MKEIKTEKLVKEETYPIIRLVGQGSTLPEVLGKRPYEEQAALLVSYVYLKQFFKDRDKYNYRNWALDSGAFSAYGSGKPINLQDYIDLCKELLQTDEKLVEIFGLDVIGDAKASVRNVEEMWRQGVEAIPTFHYGGDWNILKGLAKDYPKIAIGGCVRKPDKDKFASQCFARVWPVKLHGFGFGARRSIMLNPWHSTDATTWMTGPNKFGMWASFRSRIPVRGKQNLRVEVDWYLELERRARERWKKEMLKFQEKQYLKDEKAKINNLRIIAGTIK